ncbi:hypothetical protein AAGG74_17525 [Bacillus mexicanus]|uniref:hypothetical protein n=1 Tax=Bacillus mexicanus TaxID=2834415 RepID=UPI003D25B50F
MEIISAPLTIKEIKKRADENNFIGGVVIVKASEMYNHTYEDFLDTLSKRLTNKTTLRDIEWEIVGHNDGGSVLIEVSGDVTGIIKKDN